MVTEYGMSDLGPINWRYQAEDGLWTVRNGFYGQSIELSEEVTSRVDEEARKILDAAYKRAQDILEKNREGLEKVAQELISKETLDGKEFEKLIQS